MRSFAIIIFFSLVVHEVCSSPIEPDCVELCKNVACTEKQCRLQCEKVNCFALREFVKGGVEPQPRKGEFVCGRRVCQLPAMEPGQQIPGCAYCQVPIKPIYSGVKH